MQNFILASSSVNKSRNAELDGNESLTDKKKWCIYFAHQRHTIKHSLAPEELIGHIRKVATSLDAVDVEKGHIATRLADSRQPQHAPHVQVVIAHSRVVADVFVAVGEDGLVEHIVTHSVLAPW